MGPHPYLFEKAGFQTLLCCRQTEDEGGGTQASRLRWELAQISHTAGESGHVATCIGERKLREVAESWDQEAGRRGFCQAAYVPHLPEWISFISWVMTQGTKQFNGGVNELNSKFCFVDFGSGLFWCQAFQLFPQFFMWIQHILSIIQVSHIWFMWLVYKEF